MESSRRIRSKNILNFTCCFAPNEAPPHRVGDSPSSTSSSPYMSPPTAVVVEFAEMKEKCRNLINRFGKTTRRRPGSADFSYDITSYALNFEDARSDQLPLRNFPATPPRRVLSRGAIAAAYG